MTTIKIVSSWCNAFGPPFSMHSHHDDMILYLSRIFALSLFLSFYLSLFLSLSLSLSFFNHLPNRRIAPNLLSMNQLNNTFDFDWFFLYFWIPIFISSFTHQTFNFYSFWFRLVWFGFGQYIFCCNSSLMLLCSYFFAPFCAIYA